jgi:4-amino-4-deoxy-L-arabinose transferase-like glycosyltransferase
MPSSTVDRRIAYVLACIAPAWAVVTIVADGFVWRAGPLRIASTEPIRPLLAGTAAAAWYWWRASSAHYPIDGAWATLWLLRLVRAGTPIVVVLGCAVGIVYGTFAAAGSDAYGYLSQADLWRGGSLRIEQAIVRQVSWPEAAWTFTPLGYKPISDAGTIVPTYAPGLPLIMAAVQVLFGRDAALIVVPVFASLALAFTYALGTCVTGSRAVGGFAALLLLASPMFLAHAMTPMTDVPVAAGWALVCVLSLRAPAPRPFLAGVAAGVSLLIRPNLVLLAAMPVTAWIARRRDRGARPSAIRNIAFFISGLLPWLMAIGAINAYVYGSPLESGYGSFADLYGLHALPQNLRNYSSWLLQTQTPLVALALVPLFQPGSFRNSMRASARVGLFSLIALVSLSYLFYAPFDNWTYLRFFLPAYPALFVLMAAGVRSICPRLPLLARLPVAIVIATACVTLSVQFARDHNVFQWRDHEQRYVRGAARAAQLTPANAILFSSQHSGSLRYYTDRMTLRYDLLAEGHLDSAIRELSVMGRPSFLVIDEWARAELQRRFARGNRAGGLTWAPLARVPGQPDVLVYDLTNRAE